MSTPPLRMYRPKADHTISDFQNHEDFQKKQPSFTLWLYLETGHGGDLL